MIAVLCGGVGAARFLAALALVVDPADVVGIVNTGDDTVLHGLSISPDLDTVIYTLADAIDPQRGLGTGRRVVARDGGTAALCRRSTGRVQRLPPCGSTSVTAIWRHTSTEPLDWRKAPPCRK